MGNRIIKETIRTSRTVNALSDFHFRVWLYLITYVDDYGRGSADPELLRGLVFPRRKGITEAQIIEALNILANTGMITLYEVDGESYFYFSKWGEHQRIQQKRSKYPEPPQKSGENREQQKFTVSHRESPPEYEYEIEPESEPENELYARAREEREKDGFEAFWTVYPRKDGGSINRAYREWLYATEDLGVNPGILIAAAQEQGNQLTAETVRYFPGADKWLHNRGWEQKILPKTDRAKGGRNQITNAAEYKAPDVKKTPEQLRKIVDEI